MLPTPARRFYPYFCETDKSPVPPKDVVLGARTFGEATQLLLRMLRIEFRADPCPSIRALLTSRALVETGVLVTDLSLQEQGIDTEKELPRIVKEAGYLDSSFFQNWHHYRWHHTGRTIYDVHPALAHSFMDTEVTVQPHVLRLECPTVYLGLLDLGLTVWHQITGEHRLNGMYLSLDEERTGEQEIFVVVVGEAHPGSPANDNALCSFSIPLDGSTDIEQKLQEIDQQPDRARLLGPNAKRFVSWARLALNSLLYIQHVKEDVVHHKEHGVPPSKLAHANAIKSKKQRETYLSKYRSDVRYVQLGARFATDASGGAEREGAVVRHLVRGHWRWQVCGKGRAERRLMWIRPHWRGEDAPEMPRAVTTIVGVKGDLRPE
jgi:hypothetical protein